MFRTLRDYLSTARSSLRYEGVAVFVWQAFAKLVSPVVTLSYQILLEIDLSKPVEVRSARVDCSIGQAGIDEIDALVDARFPIAVGSEPRHLSDADEYELAQDERHAAFLREQYAKNCLDWMRAGEACFVARVDGEIAHINWVRLHDCAPVSGRVIQLADGEAYSTEAYTRPAWRGKALHEAVLSTMMAHARARGCHRAFTITDYANASSRRGVLRVGWTQRTRHIFVTLRRGGRTWLVRLRGDVTPLVRELGPSEQGLPGAQSPWA